MIDKYNILKKSLGRLFAFAFCTFVITAYMFTLNAEATTYSGTCGDDLTWTLDTDTGVLTISGMGEMTVYFGNNAPWYTYRSYITSVVIENGATSVGAYAFYKCTRLTDIEVSDSVTSITVPSAFSGCSSLVNINVSTGNTVYESYDGLLYKNDFEELVCCPRGITSAVVQDGTVSIGINAFSDCKSLASVEIPNSVTSIGISAFSNCTSLTGIEIPDSVVSMGKYVFYGCTSLTSIEISDSITNIEERMFYGCTSLTNIEISGNITNIDDGAFYNCINLTNIEISEGVTSFGDYVFYGCTNLASIEIPNSITYIGSYAFAYCSSLTNIEIPDSVTSIGEYAFYYCTGLTNVELSNNITAISNNTFSLCSNLTNVKIPDSITSINYAAFSGCYNLSSIEIPNSVTSIGDYVFNNCTSLLNIEIPESVASIGSETFENCHALNISVSEDNTYYSDIDGVLFNKDRTKIIKYTKDLISPAYEIPDSVTNIGNYAFFYCTYLTDITIPDSVISIGNHAFSFCTGLTNIVIPDSVTSIGSYLFSNSYNLESVKLSNNITTINSGTFYYCTNLPKIIMPSKLITLGGANVFYYCSKLTEIYIPATVTKIAYGIFYNSHLSIIYYGGSESDWSEIKISSGSYYKSSDPNLDSATKYYNCFYDSDSDTYISADLSENDVDKYIVEQVSKYTSDEAVEQFAAISQKAAEGLSHDEYFRQLNELFANYGITDVREGIDFLNDASEYRYSYLTLTTDEMYCAYDWYYWLNNTVKGAVARLLLLADGLVLNSEIFDYVDLSTYVKDDYLGVEKNKELLKKILEGDDSSDYTASDGVNESFKYAKKVGKAMKNIIKLNNITTDAKMDSLLNQILNCTSESELESLQTELAEMIVDAVKTENSTDTIYINSEAFSEALGYSTSIIKFMGAAAEDITDIVNLSTEIETYTQHKRFLQTIASNTEISFNMRLAAADLLDDIENGYFNKITGLLGDIISFGTEFMYIDSSLLESFLSEIGAGSIGAAVTKVTGTLKLATYISNIVVNTGDWVKQAAYAQGYAELSALYSDILEEDKQAFLAEGSTENAWQFFEDYTILWSLRSGGEKQYLDMNQVKMFVFFKKKLSDYSLKEEVVNDNIDLLQNCRFELSEDYEIPSSVQYFSKAVMNCPVNVYVYTQDGELIASLIDGVESDVTNEYGRFVVVKQSYSGEYSKVIYQSTSDKLIIKAEAVDEGLVDYQYTDAASTSVLTFDKVEVENGAVIEISDSSYKIDADSDGEADISGDLLEKDSSEYVKVEGITLGTESVEICQGGTKTISLSLAPSNATNTAVDWISEDTDIATVKNGVVYGVSVGETVVYVKPTDGDDICEEISVTVKPLTGICGNDAEWTISGSALVISGTGAVDDFDEDGAEWLSYKDMFDTVYVENGITAVGENAFYGCEGLKTIVIPDSVESIADTAFTDCTGIEEIYCYKDSAADDGEIYTVSEAAEIYYIGDVDFDKDVDKADAVLMLKFAADISSSEGISSYILDCSYDGNFDILDSIALLNNIAS